MSAVAGGCGPRQADETINNGPSSPPEGTPIQGKTKGTTAMVHNNYPIGFWNILHATQLGPEAVQDWVDFGTTLTTSGTYYPGQDKEKFIRILDACQEKGIQVLVEDARASYHNVDNGHYEEDARQVIADFAWHPAVYGFHLGDEPDGHQTEQALSLIHI